MVSKPLPRWARPLGPLLQALARAVLLCALPALALWGCEGEQPPLVTSPPPTGEVAEGTHVGMMRPAFELPDLEGTLRSVAEWDGRVVVVNFWATWCPPCRREIPAFVALQEEFGERGLQFVGIAIDEKDKVQDYVDTMGVNYPVLVGSLDAIEISKRYGNRFGALPYTVIVDRGGKIAVIHRGELSREEAVAAIKELL